MSRNKMLSVSADKSYSIQTQTKTISFDEDEDSLASDERKYDFNERYKLRRESQMEEIAHKLKKEEFLAKKNLDDEFANALPYQREFFNFYQSNKAQLFFGFLILANFVCTVIRQQSPYDPDPDYEIPAIFENFEIFFMLIFTVELSINFYGACWWRFWGESWSVFDFVVVASTWVAFFLPDLPGFSILRIFRGFRSFRGLRIIKRFEKLNDIIKALVGTFQSIIWCLLIFALTAVIWSTFCVEVYRPGFPEDFPVFFTALIQMCKFVFDWSSAVDAVMFTNSDASNVWSALIFFSYILFQNICLMSLITGIMYDSFFENVRGPQHGAEELENTDPSVNFTLEIIQEILKEPEQEIEELMKLLEILCERLEILEKNGKLKNLEDNIKPSKKTVKKFRK